MVTIFDYLDYREFLRDYYKEKKLTQPFFSYRYIGSHVDMNSSYVIKVLQGNLHISRKKIDAFVKLLGLTDSEADYFAALVEFCKAKTDRDRTRCFERLFAFSNVKAKRLEAHQYEFFRKWYYSAVWAIVDCTPFRGDYRALAARCAPPITVWDAKRAIRLLERLGMLVKHADGEYRTESLNVTTGGQWHSQAIEEYQTAMMQLAMEAPTRFAKGERDISTVSLSINEKSLPEIKELIRQFRASLIKQANSHGDSDRVYQLNVQLFPLSVNIRGSE